MSNTFETPVFDSTKPQLNYYGPSEFRYSESIHVLHYSLPGKKGLGADA